MTDLKIGDGGEIALPEDLRARYGLKPSTPVRVVETASGVLLIPLTDAPMSDALRHELDEWQSIAASSWSEFPYDSGEL